MIDLLLTSAGIVFVIRKQKSLRGTTLTAPCLWLLASLVVLASAEFITAAVDGSGVLTSPLRFAAACTTFCPLIALLGAKRPQNRGWHFVVATLWIVLSMPAWEALLLRPGQPLDVHGLRASFLMLLTLFGLANMCPTRFWPVAILFGAAQGLLIWEFMPFGPAPTEAFARRATTYGLSLIVAAIATATLLDARPRRPPSMDRLWLDFRDRFGLFWGLRVVERVNAAAQLNGWPVRLGWQGFHSTNGSELSELSPAMARALRQNLENLLGRFVSHTWIAHRLGEQVDWSGVTD